MSLAQSCPTLCDPMDCSPPGSSVHGDSPGKNTEVGCYFLLQGIFLTQGSNPGLLHCRQSLYRLSCQGSPYTSSFLKPVLTLRGKKTMKNSHHINVLRQPRYRIIRITELFNYYREDIVYKSRKGFIF